MGRECNGYISSHVALTAEDVSKTLLGVGRHTEHRLLRMMVEI